MESTLAVAQRAVEADLAHDYISAVALYRRACKLARSLQLLHAAAACACACVCACACRSAASRAPRRASSLERSRDAGAAFSTC